MVHAMLLFVLGLLPGAAESLTLATADWPPPRRVETLSAHRPLADFVRTFDQPDAGVLYIRHAGGDAGSRFAEQLRDALVALGVPAARIRLVPAAAEADRLVLEFSVNGEAAP
jgi:hypothetical protein